MLTGIRLPKDLQNHISNFPLVVGPLWELSVPFL